MSFSSGSISFRRFAVIGEAPENIVQNLIDKLSEYALRTSDVGLPEEIEYGWSGGRHVLDGQFSFDNNVYADALHFALRVDTNKVPGELKKAYQIMEEEAVAKENPSGFISKNQKRDVKDVVRQKVDDELRGGKFRRSKLYPILWDVPAAMLYCNASGQAVEKLMEIFERSFGLTLFPISSGSLGLRILESKHRRRDYEDLRPSRFVSGPEGEGQYPEYPWVAKGPEPKDFLGNEFAAWLWQEADHRTSVVTTEVGPVSIFFDRSLDLDCSYGQTGRDSLRGDGVSRMPEALDALRSGKVPRKAGLLLEANGVEYKVNLSAESLAVGSLNLPKIEEAETARVMFEERIALLREFCRTLDALFTAFLKVRTGGAWESEITSFRKWIKQSMQPVAAVA